MSGPRKQRKEKRKVKAHCIVGYDRSTERVVLAVKIPKSKFDLLDVRFEPDDPEGCDAYKLADSKALQILDLLGYSRPSNKLDYFVEPWVPQHHSRDI
jgi:hypothetical protein